MKVAVAGAGKVGRFLADDLASGGHDVIVIDRDPDLVASLRETSSGGIRYAAADACEVSSLQDLEIDQVEVMVAVTGDDEDNLVISLLAKQEFAVPRVIARVNHPSNHWLFNEAWGVDVAVSTPQILAGLVEEAVSVGVLVRLLQFDGGNTRLVEVTLAEGSPAENEAVADLGLPRGTTVVAIVRDGHVVVPRADTILDQGDEVLILASASIEDEEIRELLAAKP
ncbi:MAG: potassium channel family protein [Acidimicrobiales bacterium]